MPERGEVLNRLRRAVLGVHQHAGRPVDLSVDHDVRGVSDELEHVGVREARGAQQHPVELAGLLDLLSLTAEVLVRVEQHDAVPSVPGLAQATDAGVPIVPGGMTPTELFASWSAGASAVKVFPAGQVGPGYLKDLRGPFPDLVAVPSGGVDLAGAEAWLRAGAVAVSVGGPLLGDAFAGGDLSALRERAAAFVAVCARSEG